MPRHIFTLPLLGTEEVAYWVTWSPQVWENEEAVDTDEAPDERHWDAAPYVSTLPPDQREAFVAGLQWGNLDHRAFAYDDLLFDDPHGPQVLRDWLGESGTDRTARLAIEIQSPPSTAAIAWREAVHADFASQRHAELERRPAPTGKGRRRRT